MKSDLLLFSFFLVHSSFSVSIQSATTNLPYLQVYKQFGNYSQPHLYYYNQQENTPKWQSQIPVQKYINYDSSAKLVPQRYHQPSRIITEYAFPSHKKRTPARFANKPAPNPYSASVPALILHNLKKVDEDKKKECDGLENLIGDIGIVSYALGFVGSVLGFIDIFLSVISQFTSVTSTIGSYVAGIIGEIITFIAKTDRITWLVGNAVNIFGLIATLWGHIGLPFGDASLIIDFIGESVGLLSVGLGTISTFPEFANDLMNDRVFQQITGPEFQHFVRNYGC